MSIENKIPYTQKMRQANKDGSGMKIPFYAFASFVSFAFFSLLFDFAAQNTR